MQGPSVASSVTQWLPKVDPLVCWLRWRWLLGDRNLRRNNLQGRGKEGGTGAYLSE